MLFFKKAKWQRFIKTRWTDEGTKTHTVYVCPKCSRGSAVQTNHCPNCGKKLGKSS